LGCGPNFASAATTRTHASFTASMRFGRKLGMTYSKILGRRIINVSSV
jgi:hypothetical protein